MRRAIELEKLMRLLRLSGGQQPSTPAPIFVSIDLEVSRRERTAFRCQGSIPHIKELGIAILNTQRIFTPEVWPSQTRQIETYQFSTSQASSDFQDCDFTNFAECGFAETFRISQDQVAPTLNHYLQLQQDALDVNSSRLEQIILVGHSIQADLAILQARGVDISNMAILDTHLLSHQILGNHDKPANFTLSGILTHLKCPHAGHELHNAGNDATFTLHALLRLALKHADSQQGGSAQEATNQERLRRFADREINDGRRWEPTRKALGAHAVQD